MSNTAEKWCVIWLIISVAVISLAPLYGYSGDAGYFCLVISSIWQAANAVIKSANKTK